MRIGFGATVFAKGLEKKKLDGIGIYTQALWQEFQNSNSIFLPLTFKKNTHSAIIEENLGKNIYYAPLRYEIHSGISALTNMPLGELTQYEKTIDVFFAPDHHIPYFKNTPVIATVMDIIPMLHPEWASTRLRKLKNFAFKKAILSASHIVTVSEHSKHDLVNFLGIKEHDISIVPLGVDKKYFTKVDVTKKNEVLEKHKIDKSFFIFVGTLQPRKNVLRVLRAFKILPEHIKRNYMMVIVGQYGWESNDLMNEIASMVEKKEAIWLSYVPQDDLFALMQSARGLVYPSLYEGFGLPVIEGFASECPVITSNVTSLPEVAGSAAILVNPYEIEEIAQAMQNLVEDDDLCNSLIRRGNERVKHYTWEKSAQKHLEIFEKVGF